MIRVLLSVVIALATFFVLMEGCSYMGTAPAAGTTPPPPVVNDDSVHFGATVQPILNANCISCHSGSSPSSGFDQSSYPSLRAGGSQFGTNVVIAGDSVNSKIMRKLRGTQGSRMPLGGTYAATGLPDSLIVKISIWIMQGAKNN